MEEQMRKLGLLTCGKPGGKPGTHPDGRGKARAKLPFEEGRVAKLEDPRSQIARRLYGSRIGGKIKEFARSEPVTLYHEMDFDIDDIPEGAYDTPEIDVLLGKLNVDEFIAQHPISDTVYAHLGEDYQRAHGLITLFNRARFYNIPSMIMSVAVKMGLVDDTLSKCLDLIQNYYDAAVLEDYFYGSFRYKIVSNLECLPRAGQHQIPILSLWGHIKKIPGSAEERQRFTPMYNKCAALGFRRAYLDNIRKFADRLKTIGLTEWGCGTIIPYMTLENCDYIYYGSDFYTSIIVWPSKKTYDEICERYKDEANPWAYFESKVFRPLFPEVRFSQKIEVSVSMLNPSNVNSVASSQFDLLASKDMIVHWRKTNLTPESVGKTPMLAFMDKTLESYGMVMYSRKLRGCQHFHRWRCGFNWEDYLKQNATSIKDLRPGVDDETLLTGWSHRREYDGFVYPASKAPERPSREWQYGSDDPVLNFSVVKLKGT